MWIEFAKRLPTTLPIITRTPGKPGDMIESWRIFDTLLGEKLEPAPTHWWDGEYDFDLAIREWDEKMVKKPKGKLKGLKNAHTSNDKIGMGDYIGQGKKAPVGKVRDIQLNPLKRSDAKIKKPPKTLA